MIEENRQLAIADIENRSKVESLHCRQTDVITLYASHNIIVDGNPQECGPEVFDEEQEQVILEAHDSIVVCKYVR